MSHEPFDSAKETLDECVQGNSAGATALWNTYFERLARTADRHIGQRLRRTVDGEDVALSVIQTIYRRASTGQLVDLSDADELWKLMLTILFHKIADKGRHNRAQKRGGGQVRGNSIFIGTGSDVEQQAFVMIATDVPSPDLLVELEEERQQLFALLEDDELRHIAQRRLEGATADEIAMEINLSPRSVRRKLEVIRTQWSHMEV